MLQVLDIFGENFYFQAEKYNIKKKTKFGSFLSISIIGLSFSYFIFLLV